MVARRWYDRADNVFRKIEDVQFVSAMGPPGAWRMGHIGMGMGRTELQTLSQAS